eukprot:scaffold3066_cov178-Amphora_coffeaeformis.AAC.7
MIYSYANSIAKSLRAWRFDRCEASHLRWIVAKPTEATKDFIIIIIIITTIAAFVMTTTMNVLIIGAAGFIGHRLSEELLRLGKIGDTPIAKLILADRIAPDISKLLIKNKYESTKVITESLQVDITNTQSVEAMLLDSPAVIFHLAAIVSGDAEQNFEKGYQVNVDGMRILLEAIRAAKAKNNAVPRLVFSSSLAVYGPPLPDVIHDHWATTPRGSYGTQKAIAELFLADYTRKGYVDGVSIRFPTIAIRPGKPNAAASSFISGIIREPLHGQEAPLPVGLDFRHTVASPNAAVGYLLRAATFVPSRPGDRVLQMPGISLLVREMMDALERVAGNQVAQLIKHKPDPFILDIVDAWPKAFKAQRALELGFQPDASYDDVILAFMKEEGL